MRILFAKTNKNIVSFKETLVKAYVPIISFNNNNKKFNFIIDTGATSSLINKSVLDDLQKEQIDGNDIVCGLDPNVEFKTEKYIIPLEDNGETLNVTFGAMDLNGTFGTLYEETGIIAHGLLGSDFLAENKYILDYNKMIAYHK